MLADTYLREASNRCSFYREGQCEGLNKRSEQQIWLSRFFFFNQSLSPSEWAPATTEKPMDCSALAPYFKHYDTLVSDWLSGKASHYMPEPWWGWSCNGKPLHAVVINLNPGEGGELQSRRCISSAFGSDFHYRETMANGTLAAHLPDTTRWHRNKRELPILKAMSVVEGKYRDKTVTLSENTLCIEAYPFHSKTFKDSQAKEYWLENPDANFWKFISFAAVASRLVDGALNSIVLIRISWSRWVKLTKELRPHIEIKREIPDSGQSADRKRGRAVEFSFTDRHEVFQGVRFMCVWSGGGRNNFPSDLKDIFLQSEIIN